MNINDVTYELASNDIYYLAISVTTHMSFSDMTFISPLFRILKFTRSINPERFNRIYNSYGLAFFNKYLKRINSGLLDKAVFPEIKIKRQSVFVP